MSTPHAVTGRTLHDSFLAEVPRLTCGLVRVRGRALTLGPIQLLRFGKPRVRRSSVEWPIEGGLSARAAGGRWRIQSSAGGVTASIEGYRPMLPRALYVVAQLPVHQLFTRLYLLRVRGREPSPGPTATSADRMRAAAIDIGFCAVLTGVVARRPRARMMVGMLVGYHLACWSTSGQTLGGLVVKQRVVSSDGGRLAPTQAVLRLLALPVSWVRGRPDHDEIACTDVITVGQ